MVYVSTCPVCFNTSFRPFLSCTDYTVSHETFNLEQCTSCGFVLTNPQPREPELPRYYQSQDYISHSDKTSGLIDKLYKLARNYTLSWKYRLVKRYSQATPETLLDYGSGTGAFLETCRQSGLKVTGIEPSAAARQVAHTKTSANIFPDITQATGTFDIITLWHVLEHVSKLNVTLDELKSRLSRNGTMFIAVPNFDSYDAKKYGAQWAAYDVPRHLWHFSPKTMTQLLNRQHLKLAAIEPMPLDAYYVSLLSEKYRSGKQTPKTLINAALLGWQSNRHARNTRQYSSLIYIVRP